MDTSLWKKKLKLLKKQIDLETSGESFKDRNMQEPPAGFPVQTFADCNFDSITVIYLSDTKSSSLNISTLELKVHWVLAKILLINFVSYTLLEGSCPNQLLLGCFLVQWVGLK